MYDKHFEHFQIGNKWRSRGRTITESDLVMFSAFSGDWYPLHTDKEYAEKHTSFKQRIAHGMLVLSVAIGLQKMEPGIVVAFYGIDDLRFIKPTFIQDTIYVELEVTDLQDKDNNTGIVTTNLTVVNQNNDSLLVSTCKILVNKK
ncbi:MaoC/PaaZ C-terminal domain-containing protein [Alteribacillus sp. JSM 102045]|uniref:MaoC/PaaZ C-terminal domain-containing protein n=1 Tax=Alteribacillus sp. JSM 102045 TaxID=1562101 RepID=UPI0035BEB888